MREKNLYHIILLFIGFALTGCNKEEVIVLVPDVITFPVTDLTYQSATCGGYVNGDGMAISSRGICWSTDSTPTINDSISVSSNENGSFTIAITNLKPDSTYFVRAYATNSVGTGYGSTIQFKTKRASITVLTAPINDVGYQSAVCGGSVTSEGTSITACGICWSTHVTPTLADSITVDGHEAGSFTSVMQSLKPNSAYFVRAYATNGIDTVYGSTMTFKTKRASISVTTTRANTILHNSAICGGTISTSSGVTLESCGVCWSLSPFPTVEDFNTTVSPSTNIFSAKLSPLLQNKVYYARAYGASSNELIYGDNITFKTRQIALSITAPDLSNVTTTTVSYTGVVTCDQPTAITARGVCWSTSSTPTIAKNKSSDGIGDGSFRGTISGLTANTTYYVRTYVTDTEGTIYGDIVSFKTNAVPIAGVPTVITLSVEYYASSFSVKLQGQITSQGNSSVTSYGYYCSTSPNPVESNSLSWGYDTGSASTFSISVQSITSGVKYYIRAFAKNSYGTGYGNVIEYVGKQ